MAERNSTIRINLDNRQAVDGMNKLNKTVKKTGDEVETVASRLGKLQDKLAGMDRGQSGFSKMEKEAAGLQKRVDQTNKRVTALSSSTFALEGSVAVVSTMATAYGGVQGAIALLGVENEELMRTMVKLQAIQQVTNSLQQVAISLRGDSVAGIFLQIQAKKIKNAITNISNRINRTAAAITSSLTVGTTANTAATVAGTTATKGATLATRALSISMKAIPILGIIAGITALIVWLTDWGEEEEAVTKSTEDLNVAQQNLIRSMKERNVMLKATAEYQQDRDGIKRSTEELKLQRQIIIVSHDLSKLQKEQPDNITEIIKVQSQLDNLNMSMASAKKKSDLEEFDRANEFNDLQISNLQGQRDRLDASTEAGRKQRIEIQNQIASLNNLNDPNEELLAEKRLNIIRSNNNTILELKQKQDDRMLLLSEKTAEKNGKLIVPPIRKALSEVPKMLVESVEDPMSIAMQNWLIEWRETQAEMAAISDELTQRVLGNVYHIADGLSAAINDNFDGINDNLRMVTENILGDDGLFSRFMEEGIDFKEWFKENIGNVVAEIGVITTEVLSNLNDKFVEQETAKLESLHQSQTDALAQQLAERVITQTEYQNRLRELNQEQEMEKRQLQLQAFQRAKNLAIAEAAILTAQGVLQGLAQYGPTPAGVAAMAIAGAVGATQIALITSRNFQAADGGIVPGDGDGSKDTVPSMLAPGEVVINSKSAKAFLPLLSMINEAGGGIQLAPDVEAGSQTPPSRVYKEKQQPQQSFVVFDSMDYMNKQVNRTLKNNSF